MEEVNNTNNPRLGVDDKRQLFYSLQAMADRLLFINKFPVDMEDFALSLEPPEQEKAWRILDRENSRALTKSAEAYFKIEGAPTFTLHMYPDNRTNERVFMSKRSSNAKFLKIDNRYYKKVYSWCHKQLRLQDQLDRTNVVLQQLVSYCNTVGQYKRVSPELLTFLPDKYQIALKDYVKKSPYPKIEVSKEDIDSAISTLAFASLQPQHSREKEYLERAGRGWGTPRYYLAPMPMTSGWSGNNNRRLPV